MPIKNYEFEQLKDKLQHAMVEVMRLQRQHNDLTGRDFVISGVRNPPETRDCIYINYTPAEGQRPHSPEFPAYLEFEGEGPGGIAIAEYLNNHLSLTQQHFLMRHFEIEMSKEAEDRAAEQADWKYHDHLHTAKIERMGDG